MMRAGWIRVVVCAGACGCAPVVGTDDGAQSGSETTTSGATSPSTTIVTTTPESGPIESGEVEVATGNPTIDPYLDFGGMVDESGGCLEWASQGCALLEESNAFGSAITPLGEIPIVYAYFGADTRCGGCVDPNVVYVYLLAAPADNLGAGPPDGSVVLELDYGSGWSGPYGTPQMGSTLYAYASGTMTQMTGGISFVLDDAPAAELLASPFDPGNAEIIGGTIDADAEGWSVHVSFDARYCPDGNTYAICE